VQPFVPLVHLDAQVSRWPTVLISISICLQFLGILQSRHVTELDVIFRLSKTCFDTVPRDEGMVLVFISHVHEVKPYTH